MSKRPRSEDDVQVEKPKKLPKIFHSAYYEPVDWDGKSKNIQATCTICKNSVRGQYTSTGNFLNHYKYV